MVSFQVTGAGAIPFIELRNEELIRFYKSRFWKSVSLNLNSTRFFRLKNSPIWVRKTFLFQENWACQSCSVLRNLILDQDPFIIETVKYVGCPAFAMKKAFCYLWTAKKTGNLYILLWMENLLTGPNLKQVNENEWKFWGRSWDRFKWDKLDLTWSGKK
jgi:hypothetical protein